MSTVEQISEALQAGRVKEVLALIDAGLEDGIDAQQMLEEGMLKGMAAHHNRGCRWVWSPSARRCRVESRGLPMMGVLTPPSWKTSTCATLPSPART